ncbi:tRNA methyltransferase complex GCD14 subunit [Teratosphaeria destructans]|uniref:tRNA (adenine(58)-N(1))-methyltransferase catalytic subunit TRM61 n=1 Tax=Teratosphaeria destructans TaxID=418781 RepID=A0A9W7SQT0_9PEZI|nr:tRNA methyltransferase complex GCD14 subunit [Teratosphaeria destructans]
MRPCSRSIHRAFSGIRYGLKGRFYTFKAGDHVVLRALKDGHASPIFCKNLRGGARLDSHKGSIHHDDIIGKDARDIIRTRLKSERGYGTEYRLHEVKLEEYVRWTRRLVTPLYPQDAQLIVGLLDLHVEASRSGDANEPKLEILEAGTGHGALTLYLSRAIHAANLPMPRDDDASDIGGHGMSIQQWKASRRAVIHSIELSPKHSAHAECVVQGFRHGMYYANVDFHVDSVGDWVAKILQERNGSFLSHAFLDLPGAENHIDVVADAIQTDGTLIVFNPSITQIMDSLAKVKRMNLALVLEQVIELGVNGGSGGREWDVRAVKPRSTQKNASAQSSLSTTVAGAGEEPVPAGEVAVEEATDSGVELDKNAEQAIVSNAAPKYTDTDDWKMVCRPKVGGTIVGGGFLGVFRKHKPKAASL